MSVNRQQNGPRVLDGVHVLDFTAVISGPYCTRMMADLGADVIKIEPPGGEFSRHMAPFRDGVSAFYSQLNCGKKSIVLDLKHPAAVQIVKSLLPTYDVVVENFSPGVMSRLGLGYDALSQVNPSLIMCSISGFGQSGPGANRPAYAPIVQALSGFEAVYLQYQPTLKQPLNMGPPVGDTTTSIQALSAINAALFYRQRTGMGQYIDISMLDVLLGTTPKEFQQVFWPSVPDRIYGPAQTLDGFILIAPLSQRHAENLTACMGQPELMQDARFATTAARLSHFEEFMAMAKAWIRTLTSDEAVRQLNDARIPCAKYATLAEAITDPQLQHRDMIVEIEDAAGPLKVVNTPFLFSHTQATVRPWVARPGEHTHDVLEDVLNYTPDQIAALDDQGVFGKTSQDNS